ncbi:ketopantoate reductase family protein [Thermophagus sp. OGC60D27]|uniref:ketopantoate reductase family protein n=1 Tax=Thermophagus sp. OGC60D27 TaxID=3458415 RepID=UPI004037DDCD
MRILVIGTGGVGGYFGGRLAVAGNDVTFIARGAHKAAMEKDGLKVKSINGDIHVKPVKVTDKISEAGTPDLVIIAVKAWQVKEIARQLAPVIHEKTMVLPLQNGVLASDELKSFLPENNVLSGLCRIISKIDGPGIINHFAVEPTIVFGECDSSQTQRVADLQAVFEKAAIQSVVSKDIQADLWRKFLAICVSGLLGVTRATYGEVREQPETRQMMRNLFEEIAQLAKALKINLEPELVDKTMAFIDSFPYESTSSLTRDVWEGKPSELEYQNGTVVKLADKAGVDVPVNRFVYYSLLLMEKKARQAERD